MGNSRARLNSRRLCIKRQQSMAQCSGRSPARRQKSRMAREPTADQPGTAHIFRVRICPLRAFEGKLIAYAVSSWAEKYSNEQVNPCSLSCRYIANYGMADATGTPTLMRRPTVSGEYFIARCKQSLMMIWQDCYFMRLGPYARCWCPCCSQAASDQQAESCT